MYVYLQWMVSGQTGARGQPVLTVVDVTVITTRYVPARPDSIAYMYHAICDSLTSNIALFSEVVNPSTIAEKTTEFILIECKGQECL